MIITIFNVFCAVKGDAQEISWLKNALTFKRSNGRGGVAMECLYIESKRCFPTGWLSTIRRLALNSGVPLQLLEGRKKPGLPDWSVDLSWLYPYQLEAVKKLVAAERGILDAVTSAGKTVISVGLVELIHTKADDSPLRWAFLVRDKSLLSQTLTKYHEITGKLAGQIGNGKWSEGRFTVASTPTLFQHYSEAVKDERGMLVKPAAWSEKALKFLHSVDAIITDEVHGAACRQDSLALQAMTNAYYRFGVSGSPVGRSDKRDSHVISHFERIVHTIPREHLVAIKKVASAEVRMIRCDQPNTPSYREGGGYQIAIVNSQVRNGKVLEVLRTCEKPAIVFVKELDHGENLLRLALGSGLKAAFVQGCDSDEVRKKRIAQVETGQLDVLIASNAFKQGVDIIHLYTGMQAAGGASVIENIQRIGRPGRVCHKAQKGECLRCATRGEKTSFVWYDFDDTDSVNTVKKSAQQPLRLGAGWSVEPTAKIHWLDKHKKARVKAYLSKSYNLVYV